MYNCGVTVLMDYSSCRHVWVTSQVAGKYACRDCEATLGPFNQQQLSTLDETPNCEEMEANHNREMKAAKQEITDLKSQVANLTNRNDQLCSYIASTLKTSLPVINTGPVSTSSFAEVVKANKHPIDMNDREMETYLQQLERSFAVGNLKSPTFAGQCPSCGSPEICSCY